MIDRVNVNHTLYTINEAAAGLVALIVIRRRDNPESIIPTTQQRAFEAGREFSRYKNGIKKVINSGKWEFDSYIEFSNIVDMSYH